MNYGRALEAQLSAIEWHKRPDMASLLRESFKVDEWKMNAIMRGLEYGETYYWPPDFCALLEKAAPELGQDGTDWTLYENEFLSPTGFVYFDKPLKLPEDIYYMSEIGGGKPTALAREAMAQLGIGFEDYFITDKDNKAWAMVDRIRARVAELKSLHGQISRRLQTELDFWETQLEDRPLQAMSWTFALIRSSHATVEGEQFLEKPGVFVTFYCHDDYLGTRLAPSLSLLWAVGESLTSRYDWKVKQGHYWPGDDIPEDAGRITTCEHYFAACIAFMNQKLVSVGRERPDRASRRRSSKWRPEPLVNVVRLRRVAHKSQAESEPMEHDFRWLVSGHWRSQWYGKRGEEKFQKTIWIAPFVKGPEGKPLKAVRAKVFSVVR